MFAPASIFTPGLPGGKPKSNVTRVQEALDRLKPKNDLPAGVTEEQGGMTDLGKVIAMIGGTVAAGHYGGAQGINALSGAIDQSRAAGEERARKDELARVSKVKESLDRERMLMEAERLDRQDARDAASDARMDRQLANQEDRTKLDREKFVADMKHAADLTGKYTPKGGGKGAGGGGGAGGVKDAPPPFPVAKPDPETGIVEPNKAAVGATESWAAKKAQMLRRAGFRTIQDIDRIWPELERSVELEGMAEDQRKLFRKELRMQFASPAQQEGYWKNKAGGGMSNPFYDSWSIDRVLASPMMDFGAQESESRQRVQETRGSERIPGFLPPQEEGPDPTAPAVDPALGRAVQDAITPAPGSNQPAGAQGPILGGMVPPLRPGPVGPSPLPPLAQAVQRAATPRLNPALSPDPRLKIRTPMGRGTIGG